MSLKSRLLGSAYRLFGRLPESWRHFIVGRSSPPHRVGTAGIVRDDRGRILLCRHSYRKGWSLPGGMMGWSEHPQQTIVREIREETGLDAKVVAEPYLYWLRSPRRVELMYDMELAPGCIADDAAARSAEIEEVRWFDEHTPPELAPKSVDMIAWAEHLRGERAKQAANLIESPPGLTGT